MRRSVNPWSRPLMTLSRPTFSVATRLAVSRRASSGEATSLRHTCADAAGAGFVSSTRTSATDSGSPASRCRARGRTRRAYPAAPLARFETTILAGFTASRHVQQSKGNETIACLKLTSSGSLAVNGAGITAIELSSREFCALGEPS